MTLSPVVLTLTAGQAGGSTSPESFKVQRNGWKQQVLVQRENKETSVL